ncbi:MAG TPA: hypothetical protein DDW73_16350 [Rhizobium sp.]|nr:hypothetical protein [Rhizobium sp.]
MKPTRADAPQIGFSLTLGAEYGLRQTQENLVKTQHIAAVSAFFETIILKADPRLAAFTRIRAKP